ncbi:MAG: hypothetical protein SGCHY_005561, partial [Lobulomycetales sp.]
MFCRFSLALALGLALALVPELELGVELEVVVRPVGHSQSLPRLHCTSSFLDFS